MNYDDEPPLHKDPITITIWVLLALIIGFFVWTYTKTVSPNLNYEIREESAVRQMIPHFLTRKVVLASLMDKIIHCESGFDPKVCNKEFGCNAGMGLAQLIPKTVRYCEEKLGKDIDPFDPEDNLECAMWLLENEGTYHWGTAETVGEWGSYDCWSR